MARKALDAQPAAPSPAVSCLLPAGHLLFPVHHGDAVGPLAAGHIVNSLGAISVVYHIHWLYQTWPQSQRQSLSRSPEPSAPPPGTTGAQLCTQPPLQASPHFALICPSQEWPCALGHQKPHWVPAWTLALSPCCHSVQCLFYLLLDASPEAPLINGPCTRSGLLGEVSALLPPRLKEDHALPTSCSF